MTSKSPSVAIGPFVVGERPLPLQYQFLDGDGNPLDLSGYTAKWLWRELYGAATTRNSTIIDAADGQVQYSWLGDEFPTPGDYIGEFWVGDASSAKFASLLVRWVVRAAVGPVPSI